MSDFEYRVGLNLDDARNAVKAGVNLFRDLGRQGGDAYNKAARDALGVVNVKDVETQVAKLRLQYERLKTSGTLSVTEQAQAKVNLIGKTRDLIRETNGWTAALAKTRAAWLHVLATVGAFGVASGRAFGQYADFQQRMAEIGSITDLSAGQMKAMELQVRQLSGAMGKDATDAAAALYDILSSGVAPDNAITVLEQSSKAAIAGVTDTKTAAGLGVAVVNAYGLEIGALGGVYDKLFIAVRDGVTTFPELAQGLGQVLPVAAGANVQIGEVAAAVAELTKAGIKTPQAITGLRGAITALSAPAPEAKKQLDELGISWRGLTHTLSDIAALRLDPEALRAIIPDVEARTAVLSLTQHLQGLREEVLRMDESAGAMDAAYDKMRNSPQQKINEFKAAWAEMNITLGEAVANALPLVQALGGLVNAFNKLPDPVKQTLATFGLLAGLVGILAAAFTLLRGPMLLLLGHFGALTGAATLLGAALRLTGFGLAISAVIALVGAYAKWRGEAEKTQAAQQKLSTAVDGQAAAAKAEKARLDARAMAQADHSKTIRKIKDDELAHLKRVLDSQVKAYDEANQRLEDARKRRESIEKANQEFIAGLGQKKKPAEDLNIVDVGGAIADTRQALVAGDNEGAIKAGERAKDLISQMNAAGTESTLVLQGLAKEVAALQSKAAQGVEADEKARVDDISAAIQDTIAKAEWLKRITIGFDAEGATKNADALREMLQKRLNDNPLKLGMVVVDQAGSQDSRVDKMLGLDKKAAGGPIAGPGGPTDDKVLLWGSNGEWMMRAAAVRHYGSGFMRALNEMRIPRFAGGGLIGGASALIARAAAGLPRLAAGGMVGAGPHSIVNLTLPGGGSYAMQARPDVADDLARAIRHASLQRGGRL